MDGEDVGVTGIDPDTFTRLVRLDELPRLADDEASLSASFAEKQDPRGG